MTTIDVQHSGIWQLSSAVVADAGACLVIDPGYFPRELEELAATAAARGTATHVLFTHGHWDHVMGWRTFPGAEVVASTQLVADVAGSTAAAMTNLSSARDFDGQWYVVRPGPVAWPEQLRPLGDGETLTIGGATLRALALPGHSPDGLALLLDEPRVLFAGDYLSPCEIPFVDDVEAYRATLRRLLALSSEIDAVIPGHGPRLSRTEAAAIARDDLAYLDALADPAGGDDIRLPRAADVPGMADHHAKNIATARRR
jgi:glyoxylase-like metal-dependent hydrolase (beta-lactamase superfamily II)